MDAARTTRALLAVMIAGLCVGIGPAMDGGVPVGSRETADELGIAWRTVRDPASTPADAARAAEALVAAASDPGVREAIGEAIGPALSARSPGALLVGAVARASWPASDLFPLLRRRLDNAGPEELPLLLSAIGSFRTIPAAECLLSYANGGNSPAVTAAAFAALARLSGRDDLGPDRTAWEQWLRRVAGMSAPEWERELMVAMVVRADRQVLERREAAARLTDALRKIHLRTPPEERSVLLADWLLDRLPEVRDLGLELVSRELADTGRLDAVVGEAALRLMASPDPNVRATAAVLVRQLAPAGAARAVIGALATETDPRVATPLLLAAARWPTAGVVPAVFSWLERETPATASAWEACVGLWNAGMLDSAQGETVLAILRRTGAATTVPAASTLLCELGDDADRRRIAPLLTTGTPAVRVAIAEALLWYPEYLDPIIAAASVNPDLFSAAARGALLHEPTAAMFARVAALPSVTPQGARANLLLLAGRLSATDLLAAIRATTDPALRAALLPVLANENRVLSEGIVPEKRRAIADGIAMLAESDLQRGDAAGALAALDGAPFLLGMVPTAQADPIRGAALVALGRTDEAARTSAPLASWLRGLELCRGAAHEARVAGEILARFDDSLSDEQREVVEAAMRLAEPEDGFVGPPPPPR